MAAGAARRPKQPRPKQSAVEAETAYELLEQLKPKQLMSYWDTGKQKARAEMLMSAYALLLLLILQLKPKRLCFLISVDVAAEAETASFFISVDVAAGQANTKFR